MPIKPLSFKGDKKVKKRKHRELIPANDEGDNNNISGFALTTTHGQQDTIPGGNDDDDDTWTTPDNASDLSGPLVLVLPTTPPTCLASDMHGNVFASPLENVIDSRADTAEPHDVRQVWVVTQVVGGGSAGTTTFSFKASHGGYLSCDALGVLGARREARGVEEGFVVEKMEAEIDGADGQTGLRWRVKTAASKEKEKPEHAGSRFLCAVVSSQVSSTLKEQEDDSTTKKKNVVSISLRGDGEAGSDTTRLILKMQARFLPRLRQTKETKAKAKVSRRELEQAVGRRLDDDEVKKLKRARKEGTYHEEILDVRVKGKHDKFAS